MCILGFWYSPKTTTTRTTKATAPQQHSQPHDAEENVKVFLFIVFITLLCLRKNPMNFEQEVDKETLITMSLTLLNRMIFNLSFNFTENSSWFLMKIIKWYSWVRNLVQIRQKPSEFKMWFQKGDWWASVNTLLSECQCLLQNQEPLAAGYFFGESVSISGYSQSVWFHVWFLDLYRHDQTTHF